MATKFPHLTPSTFHILLALNGEQLHGYEIIQRVDEQTAGKIKLLTGTLYNSLKALLRDRLITESARDDRRRYYRLTDTGEMVIAEELARYQQALKIYRTQKDLEDAR